MGDAFVTLIAVQPAVAAKSGARQQQAGEPQAALGTRGGLFETLRNRQVVRGAGVPGGVPATNGRPTAPTATATAGVANVHLAFALPEGATTLVVYWSTSPLFDRDGWSRLALDGYVGSGTYEHAAPGGVRYYAFAAANEFGEGPVGPIQKVTVLAEPLDAPNSFIAKPRLGAAFLWWEAVPGAAAYALYYNAEGAAQELASQTRLLVTGQFLTLALTAAPAWYARIASVDLTGREGPVGPEISFPIFVAVAVTPASVAPRGTVNVSARVTGGGGLLSYALTTNNSGGSVDPTTGIYTAGATGSVGDVVTVSDAATGTSATCALTVTAGVSISGGATTPPLGTVALTASGGSGTGFVWDFAANNSGGTVVGGVYTAGPAGSVADTVRVTDSLGNIATKVMTVTAGVSIAPAAPTVATNATQQFTASGGSGAGYQWILSVNASGGSIGLSTGLYTAGPSAGTDTVLCTDSLGNVATTNVTVSAVTTLIPQSGAAVAHVKVQAGALLDLKGNAWAKQGAGPTMNAASSVFGKSVESMGPFTDANYYSLGTSYANDFSNPGTLSDFTISEAGGTWTISGGVLTSTVGSSQIRCTSLGTFTDGAVQCDVKSSGLASLWLPEVMIRRTDDTHHVLGVMWSNKYSIYENGVEIGSWAATPGDNTYHTLRLEAVGATAKLFVDGTLRITATLTTQLSAGAAGLRIGGGGGTCTFDNFYAGPADALDFTGDFLITAVAAGTPTNGYFYDNSDATGLGIHLGYYGGGNGWIASGSTSWKDFGKAADATTPHVFSFGRAAGTYFAKVDGQSVVSGNAATDFGGFGPALTSTATLGRLRNIAGYSWPGKLYELRATTETPSAAALDALHDSIINPGFTLKDANTVALWQFESGGATGTTLSDDCGNASVTVIGSGGSLASGVLFNAVSLGSSGANANSAALSAAMQNVVKGDYTIEGWFNAALSQTNAFPVPFSIDGGAGGATMRWAQFWLDRDGAYNPNKRTLVYGTWEGLDRQLSTPGVDFGSWTHFALRRKSIGGGKYQCDLFLNGVLGNSASYYDAITGSGTPKVAFAADSVGTAGSKFSGTFDTFRLSNKYRSDAEIAAFYQNTGASVAAPPVVIPADAAEVSHFYVKGGALHDTKGLIWNKNGTPPFNAAAALGFPNGKSAESVGAFSDANYFSLPNPADVFDLAAGDDWVVTFICSLPIGTPQYDLLCNTQWSSQGFEICYRGSSVGNYGVGIGVGGTNPDLLLPSPRYHPDANVHLYSYARAGASYFVKIDGGAVYTGAYGITAAGAPTKTCMIGRNNEATGYAWPGKIIELRMVKKTVTAADLDALHTAIRG